MPFTWRKRVRPNKCTSLFALDSHEPSIYGSSMADMGPLNERAWREVPAVGVEDTNCGTPASNIRREPQNTTGFFATKADHVGLPFVFSSTYRTTPRPRSTRCCWCTAIISRLLSVRTACCRTCKRSRMTWNARCCDGAM